MTHRAVFLSSLSLSATLLLYAPPAQAGKRQARETQDLMEQSPVLPAMVADVYALGSSPPADPVVGLAIGGRDMQLDEALSGAAATLAMQSLPGQSEGAIRWAALRSGFPFPVVGMAFGRSTTPDAPPSVLAFLDEAQEKGLVLGLARARLDKDDVWVALSARALPVGAFARQYQLDEEISLDLPAAVGWSLVDPQGGRLHGTGSIKVGLDLAGEWLLRLELPGTSLSLPLFVDQPMPAARGLHDQAIPVSSREEAILLAEALLGDLRAAAGLDRWQGDPTLDLVLSKPMAQGGSVALDRSSLMERLRLSGFVNGVQVETCQASSVADCLERLYDSPDFRVALLDPDFEYLGIEARVQPQGVHLLIGLAAE